MKVFPQLWALGNWQGVHYVIADKGYDCYAVKKLVVESGKQTVIPRRQGALYPGV
jgi:hypothetical protein